MDDVTMTTGQGWPLRHGPNAQRLAMLVGSRLCHDLISPLGAIGNGVELLQISGPLTDVASSAEVQLIAESVEAARTRINWFRMAFGHAAADQRTSAASLADLLSGADRSGRIRIRLDATGDLPRTDARLILLALMCLETAMPWGGRVLVCRGATGWRLVAEADRIKADPALWAWLDRDRSRNLSEPAPSEVHFALLAISAAEEGRALTWEMDEKGGEIAF